MPKTEYAEITGKIESFCAYRERCKHEIRQKLKNFNFPAAFYEQLISSLEEEGFINEERFAISFASGKFRIKKWGKHKIKAELLKKRIELNLITKALAAINDEEYISTLQALLKSKIKGINSKDAAGIKYKAARYAMAKGYEQDLIWDLINKSD